MTWTKVLAAALLAGHAAAALAFHEGGVGACEGCHTMHGKGDGLPAGKYLLQGSDPGSTCLGCHGGTTPGSYQVFTTTVPPGMAPVNFTPGGDFAWLGKSYAWNESQRVATSPGERHGHSVVATDYGLFSDATKLTAPGGTYPADRLTCVSCHDPHGRFRLNGDGSTRGTGDPIVGSGSYGGSALRVPGNGLSVGSYRLLGGAGYAPKSGGSLVPFSAQPPVAVAPTAYNQSERLHDVRVAYGTGMSEWCQNCHTSIHVDASTASGFLHPASSGSRLIEGGEDAIYNNYVRSGVLSGNSLDSYTSMVPYEEGTSDRSSLSAHAVSDGSHTQGPGTGLENVMCLSCHRAHASGWDDATRWNMPKSGLIVVNGAWPGVDAPGEAGLAENAQGRTQAETRAAMYDRDASVYSTFQRVLCNKCHGQG